GEVLRDATRNADAATAERTFAAIVKGPVGEAFNHLQYAVDDEVDVHRVVLAWRSWALLDYVGQDYAHTLLRQSGRFCVNSEKIQKRYGQGPSPIRALLPKLLDEFKLLEKPAGTKTLSDSELESLANQIYSSGRDKAAHTVAGYLKDGIAPAAIGEA